MPDPETTPAASSPATTTTTTTEPVAATTTTGTPAAAPTNTETPPSQEGMVPSFRLREEADLRRAAEKVAGDQQEEIERLKVDLAARSEAEETPPDGSIEQAKWLIEKTLKEKLGMGLDDVATLLQTTKAYGEDYATRQWKGLCDKHGLDAADETVQRMIHGMVKGSQTPPDEAAKAVATMMGAAPKADPNVATVETDGGVSGQMTTDVVLAKDRKHAADLAQKGIKTNQLTSTEIITRALDRAKSMGK